MPDDPKPLSSEEVDALERAYNRPTLPLTVNLSRTTAPDAMVTLVTRLIATVRDRERQRDELHAHNIHLEQLIRDLPSLVAGLEDVKAGRIKALSCVEGGCERDELQRQLTKLQGLRPFPIQKSPPIPWHVAEKAYRQYAKQCGTSQSLERLAERGGFGVEEFACLYHGHDMFHCKIKKHDWPLEATMEYLPRQLAEARKVLDNAMRLLRELGFWKDNPNHPIWKNYEAIDAAREAGKTRYSTKADSPSRDITLETKTNG